MDLCGVGRRRGAGPRRLARDARVVSTGVGGFGALAERSYAPADSLFDAPPALDDAEAAAFLHPVPHHAPGAVPARAGSCRARRCWCTRPPAGSARRRSSSVSPRARACFATAGQPPRSSPSAASSAPELAIDYRSEDFRRPRARGHRRARSRRGVRSRRRAGGAAVVALRRPTRGRYLVAGFSSDIAAGESGPADAPRRQGQLLAGRRDAGVPRRVDPRPARCRLQPLLPRGRRAGARRPACGGSTPGRSARSSAAASASPTCPPPTKSWRARRTIGRTVTLLSR